MNACFYPQITNLLREIANDIAKNIIKEGQPILLLEEYEWYREILSLLSKQVNLCDSCLLLLENGMEQEAYLLARSQFNNTLWIKYICDGDDNSRVKEYFYQPHINQIILNKNLKKFILEYDFELDESYKNEVIKKLDKEIDENRQILSQENISANKAKSIADLSKQSKELFATYITLYNEGSKFEHSDISKTKLYWKQVIDDYDADQVFVFDLGKSDKKCWLTVFRYSFMSIFWVFDSVWNRITNKEEQLFWKNGFGEAVYTVEDFKNILLKFTVCQRMLEQYES